MKRPSESDREMQIKIQKLRYLESPGNREKHIRWRHRKGSDRD
jgi:hypothetical protein